MSVAVVVDSAASLPADLAAQHAIEVVPMTIVVDGEARPDTEITTEELLGRIAAGENVSTSGPSPAAFAEAIERGRARADDVVVLTLSAEMSSTYATAELAARLAEGRVRVLDTRSAAGGEGLVALAAARRAAAGGSIQEVEDVARDVAGRVRLVATLDSLDHLARSGRVPGIAEAAAHRLHVNPLFEFADGSARAMHPAIGHRAAASRIVQRCRTSRPRDGAARLHVAALDAAATDRARALLDELLADVPDADWFVGAFGPVMLVHVGPGVSGLAWWWEPLESDR